MKIIKQIVLVSIILLASVNLNFVTAQGFTKGAIVQFKGKDGKMMKGKLVGFRSDPNSDKLLNFNEVYKVQSKTGDYYKDVDVLFPEFIKLSGGKDIGNNTCEFTFTRKDNKSFVGRLSCYFFKVVIEDIDGFGSTTYRLRDITPLSVESAGENTDGSGTYIICPHCGEKIYIDVHK